MKEFFHNDHLLSIPLLISSTSSCFSYPAAAVGHNNRSMFFAFRALMHLYYAPHRNCF